MGTVQSLVLTRYDMREQYEGWGGEDRCDPGFGAIGLLLWKGVLGEFSFIST